MSIKIKPGVMKVRKNGEMVDVGMPVYTREFEQETDGRLDAVESSLSGLQETVAGKQNTLTDADKQAIADLSEVTVTQTVTSGTEIGEVNGTKLYAPDSGMPITVINQDGTMTAADLHELEDGLYFAENAIQLMGHGGWDAVGIVQIVFGGYVVSLGVAYSGFDEEDGVYTLANSADGYGANERDNDDYLIEDPGNGEDGQVLTLTEDGYAWTDVACGVKVVKVIENAGVYSFENGEDDFAVIQDNFPNVILHLSTEYYSPVSFTTGIAYQFARINSTEASVINVFSSGSVTRFAKQLVSVGTNLLDGQIPVFSDMNGNFYASSLKKINGQSVIGSGNITIATDVHANQTVLDGITAEKVTSWDSKQDALTDDDKQAIADLHEDPDLSGYVTKEYTDTDIPAHTFDWLVENYPDYCTISGTSYILWLYPGVNVPNGVYVATKNCSLVVRYKLVDSDGVETPKVLTLQSPAIYFRYSKVTYSNGRITHVYESPAKLHYIYMNADGTTTSETNTAVYEYRLNDYTKTADLATVATSGSYNDLSDKPDDSTVDVQISGTSITENGVANIPTAYGARKGVVWCGGDKGVTSNSDGQLSLSPATNSQITSRNTEKAITPAQIDYAVKAAMTDGAGDEWTETEKESARERIGLSIDDLSISVDDDGDVVIGGNVVHYGGSEWTKVTEITITEDDTASATSIPFGDDIYCNRLIVIVDESGTSGTTYSSVRFGVLEASRSVARAVLGNTAGAWKSDCKWKTIEFECVAPDMIKYSVTSEVQLNGYVATPQVGRVISSGAQDMSKIGGLYYYGKFSAGTKMTVYGVLV